MNIKSNIKKNSGLFFLVLFFAVFNLVALAPVHSAHADAASDYCTKTYPSPKDGTDNTVSHAADMQKACEQGYNKNNCNGFKKTYNTSVQNQKDACADGQAIKNATAGGCTSILPSNIFCSGQGGKDFNKGSNGGIWAILLMVLQILTAGVGIVAVGGFVFAAILYTTSGDTPARVQQAKDVMMNIVIGIVAYALMYSVLQFIIPGGIFT